jgi:hypothetical protein
MPVVRLRMGRALLERMLVLGDRDIVAVVLDGDTIVLDIDAPDAPPGASVMEPAYELGGIGGAVMADPGWS